MSKNEIKMQVMAYVLSAMEIARKHSNRIICFVLGAGSMAGGFWMLREALYLNVTTGNDNYSALGVGMLALVAIVFAVFMLAGAFAREVKND